MQTNQLSITAPLHFFDGDLGSLHSLLLEMTDLLMYQMEQTLHAMDYADIDLALKVKARDRKVDDFRARIDQEIHRVLSRNGTLASDLRLVITMGKITDALEKIGNQIVDIARQAESVFNNQRNECDPEIMTEIIHIGGMIRIMLDKMTVVLETRNSNQAYKLVRYGWSCDTRLQLTIEQQLSLTIQNTPVIENSIDIMRILKALERCSGLCRNIAEYQILMLDSIDMRRQSAQLNRV
ncbi:MAG: phosphate signaling complex PhoU family protein [Gammaproteobacteria bacterium]